MFWTIWKTVVEDRLRANELQKIGGGRGIPFEKFPDTISNNTATLFRIQNLKG